MFEKIKGLYGIGVIVLTLWVIIGIMTSAEDMSEKDKVSYNLILEFGRTHIIPSDGHNNDSSLKGVELRKENESIVIYNMTNSCYNNSWGVNYNRYKKVNDKIDFIFGCGVVTGYPDKIIQKGEIYYNSTPDILKLGNGIMIDSHIGIDYKINDKVKISGLIFGDCLTFMIKSEVF